MGNVGARWWVILLSGSGPDEPLFLQYKGAQPPEQSKAQSTACRRLRLKMDVLEHRDDNPVRQVFAVPALAQERDLPLDSDEMNSAPPTVFVVDDDSSVLKSLGRLIARAGLKVATFESPQQFLDSHDPGAPGCLVLDVEMPGLNGIELQRALADRGSILPIIFLTGHGDVPKGVQAMKHGAVDFLTKPAQENDLLAAIGQALERDRALRQEREELAEIQGRLATLTPREREVLAYMVSGRRSKEIAAELGTGEKTIKVHRGRVMTKLEVRSFAELVRLAERAGVERPSY